MKGEEELLYLTDRQIRKPSISVKTAWHLPSLQQQYLPVLQLWLQFESQQLPCMQPQWLGLPGCCWGYHQCLASSRFRIPSLHTEGPESRTCCQCFYPYGLKHSTTCWHGSWACLLLLWTSNPHQTLWFLRKQPRISTHSLYSMSDSHSSSVSLLLPHPETDALVSSADGRRFL